MHKRARGVEIYNAIPVENNPPPPTNRVIVWFIFMYFVLLSVSVLFHSVLSDPCLIRFVKLCVCRDL